MSHKLPRQLRSSLMAAKIPRERKWLAWSCQGLLPNSGSFISLLYGADGSRNDPVTVTSHGRRTQWCLCSGEVFGEQTVF